MTTTTSKAVKPKPALTYDEILDQGGLAEVTVPLCLNGRLRRQYEDVKRRVADRTAEHEATAEATRLVLKARENLTARLAGTEGDDRLVSGTPEAAPEPEEAPYVDEEQPELDRLKAEMLRYTVPFVIRAVPEADWNQLLEDHPPRRDPSDNKRIDRRDVEDGVDTSTFYHDLMRRSIAEPEHDDAKFDRLMKLITAAQFERLRVAASQVNVRDEDLPFSPGDLESRRL